VSFTVLEVDDPADPAASLMPGEVGGRVRVQVVDPSSGTVLDEEEGFDVVQPYPHVLKFDSAAALVPTPSASATSGNDSIEVSGERILRAIYDDEAGGAADPAQQKQATARITCPAALGEVLIVSSFVIPPTALSIDYVPACGQAPDHAVYWGPCGTSPQEWTEAACSVGSSGTAVFDPGSETCASFVIVARDGAIEGSYGKEGNGVEREPSAACLLVQELDLACP
jgi:hypothetical protein